MLLCKIMKILSKMISFNLIKDGEKGEPGPMPINAGQWNETVKYIKDEISVPYVWQLNSSNSKREYYLLMKSTSLGDNPYINNTQGSGDIWRRVEKLDLILSRKIQADEIETANLVVKYLQTEKMGPRVEIQGSTIDIYGLASTFPNIRFGVNDSGFAVLTYYDNDGVKLYDLGPSGLQNVNYAPASYTEVKFYKLHGYTPFDEVTFSDVSAIRSDDINYENSTSFYKYYAGGKPNVSETERAKEAYLYKTQSTSGAKIEDGWYFTPNYKNGVRLEWVSAQTGQMIKPGSSKDIYENFAGVKDTPSIYYENIVLYKDGLRQGSKRAFWNGPPKDPWNPGGGGGWIPPNEVP